jgi:hypothetical protein
MVDTKALAKAEPTAVRAALLAIADALAQRAEREYDKNPNANGPLAQPFADAAALLEAAADAIAEPDVSGDGGVWLEPR